MLCDDRALIATLFLCNLEMTMVHPIPYSLKDSPCHKDSWAGEIAAYFICRM